MHSRLQQRCLSIPLLALCLLANCYGAISVSHNDTTSVDIGGDIEAICKVRTKVKNRSINLDLSSATLQKTNLIYIWCNTGQSNAQTTYESLNGGYLVNENGNLIPYMIQIPLTLDETNFTSPRTVAQRAGTGVQGDDLKRTIKIRPLVTGFDYAGTYRDTIKVTVAVN